MFLPLGGNGGDIVEYDLVGAAASFVKDVIDQTFKFFVGTTDPVQAALSCAFDDAAAEGRL